MDSKVTTTYRIREDQELINSLMEEIEELREENEFLNSENSILVDELNR